MHSARFTSPLISTVNLSFLLKEKDKFLKSYRIIEANVGQNARADFNRFAKTCKHFPIAYHTTSFGKKILRSHISTAQYLDTMNCVRSSKLYPRDLPDKECFEKYAGSMGISNKHQIIVYDRSPFGFFAAPRVWWTFKVSSKLKRRSFGMVFDIFLTLKYFGHDRISVLDGGFNKWSNDVSELSTIKHDLEVSNF
jgi:3-mercaptopyruvate sulfurtransferase SseA